MVTQTFTNHFIPTFAPPQTALFTGEQLSRMEDVGRSELVQGKLITLMPTGYAHGIVELNVGGILRDFVRRQKLGRVMTGEVGVYTGRNPDTVRAMDVAFISSARLAQVTSRSYLDVAPELVVEILSPDDRWLKVKEKIAEYFACGAEAVWIVDPQRESVHVYDSLQSSRVLAGDDRLTAPTLFPDFAVVVSEFFEDM